MTSQIQTTTSILSKDEQKFLDNYMDYINAIWHEYYETKGTFRAMSMIEREKQLKHYRDKLYIIYLKLNK